MKKIISSALALVVMGMTAFTAEAGIIDKCENPSFDTKGIVQAYRYEQPDGYFYGDKDMNRLDGLVYADFSSSYVIGSDLRLTKFKDGQRESVYTGFTKSSHGKRYYISGERVYGWHKIKNNWYHFDTYTGYMSVGRTKICGTAYVFDENGKWTGRLGKGGLAPSDFSLTFFSPSAKCGFDTKDSKIFYGDTEAGTAEGKIKLSSRDKQVLYCMILESGIENYSGTVFDEQYILKAAAQFGDEYEYELTEPTIQYDISTNLNGQRCSVQYTKDISQITAANKNAFDSDQLYNKCFAFFNELKQKYPYSGEYEILALE